MYEAILNRFGIFWIEEDEENQFYGMVTKITMILHFQH